MASNKGKNEGSIFRAAGDTRRNAHLDWLEDYTPTGMAEGFKAAADYVVEACLDNPRHPDVFLYPVAYLYRHYLDLQLKNIIRRGRELLDEPSGQTKKVWGHDLRSLWQIARRIIVCVWPQEDPAELAIIDTAVAEFSYLDRNGQGFRYYTDANGQRNLDNAPRVVSLAHLRIEMNKLYDLLSGCECGIAECVSAKREFEASAHEATGRTQ